MIDLRLVTAEPKIFKDALKSRGIETSIVDTVVELDTKRRELTGESDEFKRKRNEVSKQIGAMKAKGQDTTEIQIQTKKLGDDIDRVDRQLDEIKNSLDSIALTIPNIPLPDVPFGASDADNIHVKHVGKPRDFDFEPKAHWDLGADLDILDNARAAKLSGARFNVLKRQLAKLQRSLITYMLDMHTTQHGFYEVFAPVLVTDKTCLGTGQLPKFAQDMYKIEGEEMFLISTNEITLINMHANEILKNTDLPIRYTGFALCFRKEAGAAGRDTRGLIRVHQFEKVEMVTICKPEDSERELQHLIHSAGSVLEGLGLPYRVSFLCTADMSGFSAAKTYDLEVWMPSYGRYVEVSSCSNCTDFQSRRAGIRFKEGQGEGAKLAHTLNGSGLAIGRTMAAIMENYQQEDGTIRVPEALIKLMGTDIISNI